MSTRRTTEERIEANKKKQEQMKNAYRLLLNQQKKEERKARNHRIARRGAHLESLLPDTIMLTDERFDAFLKRTTANGYGRSALAEFVAEQQAEDAANNAAADPQDGETIPAAKTEEAEPDSGDTAAAKLAQTGTASNGTDGGKTRDGARPGS